MTTILLTLPGQRRALHQPREELLRRRDERVRDLVAYAAEHVPYYRGLDPGEFRAAEDLERLPLLDKATVQRDPEQFRPNTPLGRTALTFRTAGSTGEPVTVFRDRRSLLESIAYAEREREVEVALAGRRYRYDAVAITGDSGNFERVREFYGQASFRPLRPRQFSVSISRPPEEHAVEIARLRPLVLRGFGSAVELLYRTAHARGWEFHRPAVIVYGGDAMTTEARRLIQDEFGVPVISRYSAAEAFRIGFTCEHGGAHHLHEDLCVVRAVAGELIVTDLLNRGMVLLNYRLGDLGRLGEPGCACGRTSLRLTELDGRTESIVRLGDGALVHPRRIETVVRQHRDVLRYQLVQSDTERFELRLVTERETPSALVPELRELLHGAVIRVTRCAELAPGRNGKFQSVVGLRNTRELADV